MGGRVYAKILSNLKDGMLANWIPSLNGSLPAENRRVGIKPGDVGMVTPHGGFDFGYNIFRDSDDPFNLHGAPEGHEPLQEHSWSTDGYYSPGHVTKREQRSTKSFNAGVSSVFGFNAGVLVDRESGKYASCSFPEGANFEAFQNTRHLKQYMKENGDRLVDFLYKTLGRQGDPVVVIECIKTPVCVLEVDSGTAWSTGASASALASAHLEFGITTTVSGSRITREISSDEFGTPNKCPFMKVIHLPRRRFGRRWTTGETSEAVVRVSSATIPASITNADVDLTLDVVDARSMSMHSDSVAPTPLDDRAHNDNGVTYGVPIHSMNAVVDTSTALPESCSSAVNSDDSGSCLKSRNLISVPQETFTQSPGNEPSLLSTLTSHTEPPSTTPSFVSSDHSPMNAPPSPTSSPPSSMHSATSFAVRDSAPVEAFGYEHSFLSSATSSKPHVDPLSQTQAFTLGLSLAGTPDGNGGEKSSKATVESLTKGDNGHDGNWPRQDQFMNAPHRQEIPNLTNSSPKRTDVDHEFILSQVPAHSGDPNVFSNCTEVRGDKDAEVEDSAKQAPGSDVDDDVDPTPFAFAPFTLASMFDHKDLEMLEGMGGTSGLLTGIGTHRNRGLDMNALPYNVRCSFRQDVDHLAATENDPVFAATLEDRRRIYGENVPSWTVRTHSRLMWQSLMDTIFVLVTIGVIIFLVLGLFEDFRSYADWGEDIDLVAVCIILGIIGSLNDWRKQRQLRVNDKEERRLSVVRGGVQQVIDVKEAVVGDIAILEPDEIIPCDGVFLSGDNVECHELVASGKSIAVRKVSYEECMHADDPEDGVLMDCFVVSGSKVVRGVGSYVVVAVGTKSLSGRITMALQANTENTPLQLKLSALADFVTKLGRITAILRFVELGLRFCIQLGMGGAGEVQRSCNDKHTIAILIIIVTLIVAAFAKGIPLSVCSWIMEHTTTKIVPEDRRSGLSC